MNDEIANGMMQKATLQLLGYERYLSSETSQVWTGSYFEGDFPHWCLLVFEHSDQSSMRVLRRIFSGLRTHIQPAKRSDVRDILDSREGVVWCFSRPKDQSLLEQMSHGTTDGGMAGSLSYPTVQVGSVGSHMVFLPTLEQINTSLQIKQKLWQYFLHLK